MSWRDRNLAPGGVLSQRDSFIFTPKGHWDSIRPGMLRKVLNVKIHATPASPVAAFTATITEDEVKTVQGLVGRNRQLLVIGDGPIMSHHKIVMIRRPSSQVHLLGSSTARGTFQPGLLHLLRVLLLDRFVSCVRGGRPFGNFKRAIIFFRCTRVMGEVNSWLMSQTGYKSYIDAPFVMTHSKLSKSDEAVLQCRIKSGDILLFLTTSRLLLGVNIPGVNLVVMVRPPSKEHALVQACGRAGRLKENGLRETSMIVCLFNSQDLSEKNISPGVKELCTNNNTCLKQQLRQVFVGDYPDSTSSAAASWCCSNCDRTSV